MSIEAMRHALEALQYPIETPTVAFDADKSELLNHRAIELLCQAIAEAETKQWIERGAPGATVQIGTERIVIDHTTGKLATEQVRSDDYRAMYLKVRDELAALQQSRAPLTSKEIRAIEVDVATNLSLDYPSPAEQFTRAIEARHGIKG